MVVGMRPMKAALAGLLLCALLSGCAGPAAAPLPPAPSPSTPSAPPPPAPPPSPSPTTAPSGPPPQPPAPSGPLKGITLSPQSFEAVDFTDFFAKAPQAGKVVTWAGDWSELGITTGGAPKILMELAKAHGLTPVVEAQLFSASTGQLLRPLDEATLKSYKDTAAAFARAHQPPYLALGVEVNVLYEKSPADFDLFVRLFKDTYGAVKAVSPGTEVFTVFQLEKMKGLNGGLFGGANDPARAEWHLLDRFARLDLVGFTTYPGVIYRRPADIPADYYSEVKARCFLPIAYTEIGWHSAAGPAGWESSEAEQAEFVRRFFSLTAPLRSLEMTVWSFMYGQAGAPAPFDSTGLRRADGTAKAAWEEWAR